MNKIIVIILLIVWFKVLINLISYYRSINKLRSKLKEVLKDLRKARKMLEVKYKL